MHKTKKGFKANAKIRLKAKRKGLTVNEVIIDSIPVNRGLKRSLLSWYHRMQRCNGDKFAADAFKALREYCLRYRADPHRLENLERYVHAAPFRHKGRMRQLLRYLDAQPEYALNLLKLYVGIGDPLVTVTESADAEDLYLRNTARTVNVKVPRFLSKWVNHFSNRPMGKEVYTFLNYGVLKGPEYEWLRHYCRNHTYEEYCSYHKRWNAILRGFQKWRKVGQEWFPASPFNRHLSETQALESAQRYVPKPEMYVDLRDEDGSTTRYPVRASDSLDKDYWILCSWLDALRLKVIPTAEGHDIIFDGIVSRSGWCEQPTLSREALLYLKSLLTRRPEAYSLLEQLVSPREEGASSDCWDTPPASLWMPSGGLDFLDGEYVGHIQHIPKHGTVKRRPIAVPNRFIQMGLAPLKDELQCLQEALPCDCTFKQDKFDTKITNRVSNSNLYVGSVDLSQATDNLPRKWGYYILDVVLKNSCPTVLRSYDLFKEVAAGRWENDGILSSWPVGQPLGTLPSFGLLAITHNLLLESLGFVLGLGHSPYCILGDDLLVFNKKLRRTYIRFMQHAGVPLSLHKSYEGNLVEFAGKTFVRNHIPFYTSDQAPITWNSLFDYQRATGVLVPWEKVPRKIQTKFKKLVVDASNGRPTPSVRKVYGLCQMTLRDPLMRLTTEGVSANKPNGKFVDVVHSGCLPENPPEELCELLADVLLRLEEDKEPQPDPELATGIVSISGHPVTYADVGYSSKGGHMLRYRKRRLPEWYKDKFRPCATDKLVRAATLTLCR